MKNRALPVAALLAFLSTPAQAELPEPVRAMIEAAIETGNAETVAAVIAVARSTNPGDVAEIDAIEAAYNKAQAAEAARLAAAKKEALRTAGLFENWSGKGELGAFHSSGNSNDAGVTGSITLARQGIDWKHKLRVRADYKRSGGETTREQFYASYEPRYQINDRLFTYGLGQWERDRFQGYSARYAVSGGLGYTLVERDAMNFSVKAGPAWRITKFVDGSSESSLAGLVGADFDWRFAEGLKFTQDANVVAESGGEALAVIDSNSTSITLVTGLDAQVSDRLTTRLSYTLEYDSNPPDGAVSSDTLTRFTLVYGF